ncbi:hypothetical protein [Methylobacterium sp. NFXW15]|uniref:hypothetical protein n=1 Tax=Methylobacterium sp. NFXW15 TaxID=2819512 RepID=UPI003CEAF02B
MLFEILEARKRQIAQQYHHARRMAAKHSEPFNITHREWLGLWQRQPDPTEPGRIIRLDTNRPWSLRNSEFYPCEDMGQPQLINQGVRTLSVNQWVREMRGQR